MGTGIVDNSKPATADIGYFIPAFQNLPLLNLSNDTVKMSGISGDLVGYCGSDILNQFVADCAFRRRKRTGGYFYRNIF